MSANADSNKDADIGKQWTRLQWRRLHLERIDMLSEHEWSVRDQINAEIIKVFEYLEESGWLPPHDGDHPEHECLVCENVLAPLSSAAYVGIDWEEEPY